MVTHVFSTFPIPEAFLAFAETFIQDLVTAGTFSSLHPEVGSHDMGGTPGVRKWVKWVKKT